MGSSGLLPSDITDFTMLATKRPFVGKMFIFRCCIWPWSSQWQHQASREKKSTTKQCRDVDPLLCYRTIYIGLLSFYVDKDISQLTSCCTVQGRDRARHGSWKNICDHRLLSSLGIDSCMTSAHCELARLLMSTHYRAKGNRNSNN